MTPHSVSSPVSLSYVAALRGVAPRKPGTSFTYALANCQNPLLLMCLAASNPEGRFYGLMTDGAACTKAQDQVRAQNLDNLTFIYAKPGDIFGSSESPLPPLNYLCADENGAPLNAQQRKALFDLAEKTLTPGGLFHYAYRAYDHEDGALRFLVREFGPEMGVDQAGVFLGELKAMGKAYFGSHPAAAIRLNDAIARKMPDEFFGDYDGGDARSNSFDTVVALRPRGFVYVGDSDISCNYVDLAVPAEAQAVILSCRENFLYEPLKDFALNRMVRSDIWCKAPARGATDVAELFGSFAYGIVVPLEGVPETFKAQGKNVDLSSPLYRKLAGLMTLMPLSIGDFLSHPDGKGFTPIDVVGAVQILVACGIAQPMRGMYRAGSNLGTMTQPRFAGSFNRFLGQAQVSDEELLFASPALGSAVSVPAREALVMQALDKAGLANSVSALLPELQRLARTSSGVARTLGTGEPTATTAHTMIEDTVSRSIAQWYAYGLLEAA